jgi:dUTP pyrophosphatase
MNVQLQRDIQIKYHNPELIQIEKIDKGDWVDLRAAENVSLKAGESALISFGVSMKLPDGYEAYLVPRSSTFKTWGILQTNSVGIIDNSYSGDNDIWKMPVLALL